MATRWENATELHFPLGVLAPTVGSTGSKDYGRVADECSSPQTSLPQQKMAICEDTGLLAIANGRIVELYQLDAIKKQGANTNDTSTYTAPPSHATPAAKDPHLPYAGQIILSDVITGDDTSAMYATSVFFAAPGVLFVASTSASDSDPSTGSDSTASMPVSSRLSGFRLYSRRVGARLTRYALPQEPFYIHVLFSDLFRGIGAISAMKPVPVHKFSDANTGACVVLFCPEQISHSNPQAPSSAGCFGVFQWAERFSDRELSVSTPMFTTISTSTTQSTAASALSAVAVSEDAQWIAIADMDGGVVVLDFRRFAWERDAEEDDVASISSTGGRRLVLGRRFRMGREMGSSRGGGGGAAGGATGGGADHPLDVVRVACQARVANAVCVTCLCWWKAPLDEDQRRSVRYLLAGLQDGALTVMALVRTREARRPSSFTLKTAEIYPALRKFKNDPVLRVTTPQYDKHAKQFQFSVVSSTSWRLWPVKTASRSEDDEDKGSMQWRLTWPTLTESLGLPTYTYERRDVFGMAMLWAENRVAIKLSDALPSPLSFKQFEWLLLLTRDGIRALGQEVDDDGDDEEKDDEAHEEKTSDQGNTNCVVEPELVVSTNESHTHEYEGVLSSSREDLAATVQNVEKKESQTKEEDEEIVRFEELSSSSDDEEHETKAPAMASLQNRYKLPPMASSSAATSSSKPHEEPSSSVPQRLTKDQYNTRLAAMAQRVETMSTNLHSLRQSFHLFTNDVQTHMAFMSRQLEQLQQDRQPQTNGQTMKSYLQAHAEMSRLDDSAAMERRRSGGNNNSSTDLHQHQHQHQPVVPHLKEKYDPEHPDGDWAGNVHRSYKKKAQYSDHSATRQNLVADEKGGIMPDAHAASTATSSFSGKKLFDAHQLPAGDPSVPGIKFQSAVYQVGPGADISCSNWKTSYEAQTSAETTPQDVYALGSRQNTQHRRHVTPMYEKTTRATHRDNNYGTSSPFSSSSSPSSSRGSSPVSGAPLHASGSSGSLSGRRIEPRKSLLAGIGKLVAADDVGDKLVRPEHHLSQGYTDPTKKILIAENQYVSSTTAR